MEGMVRDCYSVFNPNFLFYCLADFLKSVEEDSETIQSLFPDSQQTTQSVWLSFFLEIFLYDLS